jgi:hypothetical protein
MTKFPFWSLTEKYGVSVTTMTAGLLEWPPPEERVPGTAARNPRDRRQQRATRFYSVRTALPLAPRAQADRKKSATLFLFTISPRIQEGLKMLEETYIIAGLRDAVN